MRLSYSLGSLLSVRDVLGCADVLRRHGPDTVWIPETWGMECFSMLGAVSQRLECKIGSSIVNTYSRSPALIAMGAVTVDTLSGGRFVLGLGTSSRPIVEDLHGYGFERPLARMREYIEIIRELASGSRTSHRGEFFDIRGFSLLTRPVRERIPIYLAAVNERMTELALEMADGVIFYLRPIGELRDTISGMGSRSGTDTACQIITAVSEDGEAAARRAKATIAFYVSVGGIYREFLSRHGFRRETECIYEEFARSGLGSGADLVPDAMADALAIYGTPDECRRRLRRFRDAGVDLPIVQFNPVGDTLESFRLLTSTFSGDDV